MSYFSVYTLRNEPRVLPNRELEPEHADILTSLKPENQPYVDASVRGGVFVREVEEMDRKEILEKLG